MSILSFRCILSWYPGKEVEKKIKKSKGKSGRAQSFAQTSERFWSCNMVLKLDNLELSRGNEGSRPERTWDSGAGTWGSMMCFILHSFNEFLWLVSQSLGAKEVSQRANQFWLDMQILYSSLFCCPCWCPCLKLVLLSISWKWVQDRAKEQRQAELANFDGGKAGESKDEIKEVYETRRNWCAVHVSATVFRVGEAETAQALAPEAGLVPSAICPGLKPTPVVILDVW